MGAPRLLAEADLDRVIRLVLWHVTRDLHLAYVKEHLHGTVVSFVERRKERVDLWFKLD